MPQTLKQLHKLEEELIQLNGLMQALQKVMPDGEAHNCVANALETSLQQFQQDFYEYWELVSKEYKLKDTRI